MIWQSERANDQVKLVVNTISNKETYRPFVSEKLARLSKMVVIEFDELDYCLRNTEWPNDFTSINWELSFV